MASNRLVDILAPKIVGPEGPYRTIYLDPPWPERGGGKSKRGADRHYDTLTVRQIEKVVLDALQIDADWTALTAGDAVARDAHCWMWVTDNYLPAGLDLMSRMGFNYKRTLVWAKISPGNINAVAREIGHDSFKREDGIDSMEISDTAEEKIWGAFEDRKGSFIRSGLGQYARGSHEILLFGTKGKAHMPPTDARPKSVQFAPISEHSAKPDLFYDIIEACSPGPRLEMFARNARPGWAVFGNEVDDA